MAAAARATIDFVCKKIKRYYSLDDVGTFPAQQNCRAYDLCALE